MDIKEKHFTFYFQFSKNDNDFVLKCFPQESLNLLVCLKNGLSDKT